LKETNGSNTASGNFGFLHAWLTHHCLDSAYDPIREAIGIDGGKEAVQTPADKHSGLPRTLRLQGRQLDVSDARHSVDRQVTNFGFPYSGVPEAREYSP
jgi:hypothetical protein